MKRASRNNRNTNRKQEFSRRKLGMERMEKRELFAGDIPRSGPRGRQCPLVTAGERPIP
jgi:hypothetical protein